MVRGSGNSLAQVVTINVETPSTLGIQNLVSQRP